MITRFSWPACRGSSRSAGRGAALGFAWPTASPAVSKFTGGMPEVARANRESRIASRVLLRIGAFRAMHLAQLDKRAAQAALGRLAARRCARAGRGKLHPLAHLSPEGCGAAVERAIADIVGAPLAADGLRVMLRIDDDLATISVDTSGEGLHKRGHKQFTGKAPLRETMAAGFLRQMGYRRQPAGAGPDVRVGHLFAGSRRNRRRAVPRPRRASRSSARLPARRQVPRPRQRCAPSGAIFRL